MSYSNGTCEPLITINGTTLTDDQAFLIRITVQTFMRDTLTLKSLGLTGVKYDLQCREILRLMEVL